MNNMGSFSKSSQIAANVLIHNKIARNYEKTHGEIYNQIEQARLRERLSKAISYIDTEGTKKTVLDFGCGAGNLTRHLTLLGCDVIACDVAQGFLDLIGSRTYGNVVTPVRLNGVDLSNIVDNSVDMVATYSVLHHVPDYLGILKEFMRVLKRGGVVFIDHEPSDEFWLKGQAYRGFEREMKNNIKMDLGKFLILTNYYDWFVRKFINPRYHREGDIHVFTDDHVEWDKVINTLVAEGGKIVYEMDYLLYRRHYDLFTYNKHKEKTSDMHVLVVKKY